MPDMIPVALRIDCMAYNDRNDRRQSGERRQPTRVQVDRRKADRRQEPRYRCNYNDIESQLQSRGAKHIECYFGFDNVLKVNCKLPLDKVEEVKYIKGVEVLPT